MKSKKKLEYVVENFSYYLEQKENSLYYLLKIWYEEDQYGPISQYKISRKEKKKRIQKRQN